MGIIKKIIFLIGLLAILYIGHQFLQEEYNTPIEKIKCLEIINKKTPLKCHLIKLLEKTEEIEDDALSEI